MDKFFERLSVILNKQARHLTRVAAVSVKIAFFPFVACTDGLKIMINRDNDIRKTIDDNDKEKLFVHFKGLNFHELGHILFSDFDKLRSSIDTVDKGDFYPCPPTPHSAAEEIYLEKLSECVGKPLFKSLFKNILNIAEDIWMELKVMTEYPGTKSAILFNAKKLLEDIPDFDSMKTNAEKVHNLLLKYARGGKIETKPEFDAFLSKAIPFLDKAITTDSFDERAKNVNQILLVLYPLLASEMDDQDAADNIESQTPDHSDENPDPNQRRKDSQGGSGDSKDSSKKSKESKDSKDSKDSKSPEGSKDSNGSKDSKDSKDSKNSAEKGPKKKKKKKSSKDDSSSDPAGNSLSDARKEMTESLNSDCGDDLLSPEEIGELSKILKELRKEDEIEQKENDILSELKAHENGFKISRAIPEQNPVDVKKYVRKFSQVLRTLAEDDGEEDELLFGQELDANSLHRRDGKHFVSFDDKEELSMSICVMIDSSGSMRSDGRYNAAEICATTLYDFCKEAKVPIAIYSHNTEFGTTIKSIAEFNSVDGKDRNRIHLHPSGCNDDSKAFKFAKERIMERDESIRLLVMISDGQPSCEPYDVAKSKIQEDLKELKKKGIIPIAAAIGDDKPNIKDIYGSAFVDMTDLSKFPQKMLGIIQSVAGL